MIIFNNTIKRLIYRLSFPVILALLFAGGLNARPLPKEGDWIKFKVLKKFPIKGGTVWVRFLKIEKPASLKPVKSGFEVDINEGNPEPKEVLINEYRATYEIKYQFRLWFADDKIGKVVKIVPVRFFTEDFHLDIRDRGAYIYEEFARVKYEKSLSLTHPITRKQVPVHRIYMETIGEGMVTSAESALPYPMDVRYYFDAGTVDPGWIKASIVVREVPILGTISIPLKLIDFGSKQ